MMVDKQLQEPKVVFAEGWEFGTGEVRNNFGNHFRVFDSYGQVLLLDGFPINAAEFINLIQKCFHFSHIQVNDFILFDFGKPDTNGEKHVAILIIAITGIVVKQELVATDFKDGST